MHDDPQWPALEYAGWRETCTALHLWTQIVGKIRLRLSPWVNHSWHVTLYVSACGLTTGLIPCGRGSFEIEFDFIEHRLAVRHSDGRHMGFELEAMSVADFHRRMFAALEALDVHVQIHGRANEVEPAVRFRADTTVRPYDASAANRFWRALVCAHQVFSVFRSEFQGKCSPVHFFWGSFDLAVTRFSGRAAPEHPGGIANLPDWVTREAYSHEVSSAGFWPGGPARPEALFYSYAYPVPAGFAEAAVRPDAATFDKRLGEFVLPYEAVRRAEQPEAALLAFLRSTYLAAAQLGQWPRSELERSLQPVAGGERRAG